MPAFQDMIKPSDPDYFPRRRRAAEGRPGGIFTRYVKCSDPLCKREEEITDGKSVELPTPVLRKKFLQKGWVLGKNREHDTCPVCVANNRVGRRKQEEPMKVVDTKGNAGAYPIVPSTPSPHRDFAAEAPEPKKMDTDERRIIFAAVDERWAGKEAGYTAPWTDQAIASHLGVPLAWVIEVRSQFFGEVRDNQEIRDLLERASRIIEEASHKVAEALQLQKDTSSMIVRVNAMNKTLEELRRSVEGLAAIATRIERSVK